MIGLRTLLLVLLAVATAAQVNEAYVATYSTPDQEVSGIATIASVEVVEP